MVPLMIQCLPSSLFLAVVWRPITSLPAKASEMARQINFLPAKTSGTMRAFNSGEPKLSTGGRPMTAPELKPRSQHHQLL